MSDEQQPLEKVATASGSASQMPHKVWLHSALLTSKHIGDYVVYLADPPEDTRIGMAGEISEIAAHPARAGFPAHVLCRVDSVSQDHSSWLDEEALLLYQDYLELVKQGDIQA